MNRTRNAFGTACAAARQLTPNRVTHSSRTTDTIRRVRMMRPFLMARVGRPTGTRRVSAHPGRSLRWITIRTAGSMLLAGVAFLMSSVPAEAAHRAAPPTAAPWARSAPAFASTFASTSASMSMAKPVVAAGEVFAVAANQTADLPTVLNNATKWVVGILATVATLFLTIGGARYLMAGGDPGEVERAKGALKSAGIGYALALLAPVLLQILRGILGVGG
jgi:hypothetical protein